MFNYKNKIEKKEQQVIIYVIKHKLSTR